MSYPLPTADHPARELIDVAHVAEVLHPDNAHKLPAIWQARRSALEFFAAEPAARRLAVIVVRADTDEKWLVTFGRKGGWRKEWNFGTGRAA
jgi:hypothetical protein